MEVKVLHSPRLGKVPFHGIVELGEVPAFSVPIGGRWVFGGVGSSDVRSPIDGAPIARVPRLSRAQVERALATAYERGRWDMRNMPGERRLEVFHRAADLLERYRETFVEVLVVGNGKLPNAANGEVTASIERLRRADLDVRRLYGEYVPGDWSAESLEGHSEEGARGTGPRNNPLQLSPLRRGE